ncbi:MAG TPA: fibronectin type III domain-containing protein, partial [candidate division Zixibacteria bacterium]|nr:fibronectin type III domain-containing protein [candidate division Zixibacteria bacterium]
RFLRPTALLLLAASVFAQQSPVAVDSVASSSDTLLIKIAPVTSLLATDFKYDDGEKIELSWVPSIDDQPLKGKVESYKIYRIVNDGAPEVAAKLLPGANSFADEGLSSDSTYSYYVVAESKNDSAVSIHTQAMSPHVEWIDLDKKYLLLIALIIGGSVVFFIETARRGKKLFVRKIAGLEAVDEAVGRATEMGRPILFIPGIQDMDDVQTLAGLTILGRISRVVADYDTKIFMPVSRSLVMTAGRETIKASYQTAGRPDAYSDDMVSYVTDEQFGYVAAVDGIMVRERPATVFLLGAFFAESLILAETGNYVGAIQIAGTARPAQLPFFIAACDFTLIGEELFAASAYLSGEPKQLGSLKGQDVGKAIAMVVIILGVIAITASTAWHIDFMHWIGTKLNEIFSTQ